MPAQRILLLRHAEGEHNLIEMFDPLSLERFAHHVNVNQQAALTEKGLDQARAIVDLLEGETIHKIIVSPFDRTLATIQPYLEKHGVEPETWVELSEILPPPLREDLAPNTIELPAILLYAASFAKKLVMAKNPGVPETLLGSWNRVGAAFWRLAQQDGTVLAVTHGGVIGAMAAQAVLAGTWKVERFSLSNAEFTELIPRDSV